MKITEQQLNEIFNWSIDRIGRVGCCGCYNDSIELKETVIKKLKELIQKEETND